MKVVYHLHTRAKEDCFGGRGEDENGTIPEIKQNEVRFGVGAWELDTQKKREKSLVELRHIFDFSQEGAQWKNVHQWSALSPAPQLKKRVVHTQDVCQGCGEESTMRSRVEGEDIAVRSNRGELISSA